MIVFYSVDCQGCKGNQSLMRMKAVCNSKKVDFQERRTIFWQQYEREANAIMDVANVKLPFFYGTNSHTVLEGDSFTPITKIEQMVQEELKTPNEDEDSDL